MSHDGAVFVGDYRYLLWRTWDDTLPRLLWVMLNPSTADATTDDPTIRRCVGFSKRWGYGGIEVVNLFAFRTTDWRNLPQMTDPVGPENDRYIAGAASRADGIVVAWGEHGGYLGRDQAVLELLGRSTDQQLYCLGTVRNGCPCHPLRLARSTNLRTYRTDAR